MASNESITPKFELLVGGSPAPSALLDAVILLRARQHLDELDTLEVRLDNHELDWSESDLLREGVELAFRVGYEGSGESLVLIATGEIVRREFEFPADGNAVLSLVAYDKGHRLKRRAASRSFVDQKDSEIAARLAQEAGLSPQVTDSKVKLPYVLQAAQSDLAFLRERAALYGFEVRVDRENDKLYFGPPTTGAGPALTLRWGADLYSFDLRYSSDEQVSEVLVRGWDMATKQHVLQKIDAKGAPLTYRLDAAQSGPSAAEVTHGKVSIQLNDRPLVQEPELRGAGQARLDALTGRFCEGYGSCRGDARLEAGSVLEVQGTGRRTDGRYYVTAVLHFFEPGVGYTTCFDVVRAGERAPQEPPPELPPPLPPRQTKLPEPAHWVEIAVTSDAGDSLEGVPYTVTLPNGAQQSGTLDARQVIRVEGVRDKGQCQVELHPPPGAEPVGFSSKQAGSS